MPANALTHRQHQQLVTFLTLLQQWNRIHNLTAIRTPHKMVTHHISDSLAITPYIVGQRILDLGTGAGLPGIPLAIMNPQKQFVLLDSRHKKTHFCQQAKRLIGLDNVIVVHARVETWQTTQCFDHIITRAFGTIDDMLKVAKHLCCEHGNFLAMKGDIPNLELAKLTDKYAYQIHRLVINGLHAKRHLICIQQERPMDSLDTKTT